MKAALLYGGAAIVILWGLAHIIIPTRAIVDGFGPISADSKRIPLMEWLMEGVLLIFIGVLVALITSLTSLSEQPAVIVYRTCASVLVIMAGISLFTGARTAALPMKFCPPIFLAAAGLFFLPTVV